MRILRLVSRRLAQYFRHDFPEMVWPSSLPNPPGEDGQPVQERRLSLREHAQVWHTAVGLYITGWMPEKKAQKAGSAAGRGVGGSESGQEGEGGAGTQEEAQGAGPTEQYDKSETTFAGEEVLSATDRDFIRRALMARLTAYADALRQFHDGYREGFEESAKKHAELQSQDPTTKP